MTDEEKRPLGEVGEPIPDEAFGELIDVEDKELQHILSCLAPPDDMAECIKKGIDRRPMPKLSTFRRIATITAVLLIGFLCGVLAQDTGLFTEEEAEAASLQNHISGYARNSQLFEEEAKLLQDADPIFASGVLHSELQLASLGSYAASILKRLQKTSANLNNKPALTSFFSDAVVSIGRIENLMAEGNLTKEDFSNLLVEISKVVPPKSYSLVRGATLPITQEVKSDNPELRTYLIGRQQYFSGDIQSSIASLDSLRNRASSTDVNNLSQYWITRGYQELGMAEKARIHLVSLPVNYRRVFISPNFNTMPVGGANRWQFTITFQEDAQFVISKQKDGSWQLKKRTGETYRYLSMKELKESHGDVYKELLEE